MFLWVFFFTGCTGVLGKKSETSNSTGFLFFFEFGILLYLGFHQIRCLWDGMGRRVLAISSTIWCFGELFVLEPATNVTSHFWSELYASSLVFEGFYVSLHGNESCTTKDDDYPIIYRVSYIRGGCLGFLPSTVWFNSRCWLTFTDWRWRQLYPLVCKLFIHTWKSRMESMRPTQE